MRILSLIVLSLVFVLGCGEDDSSPTSPGGGGGGGGGQINTPKSIVIRSIWVNDFAERKSSIATWDASLSVAPRRPDVFVELYEDSTSGDPIFVSTIDEDAFPFTFIDMSVAATGSDLPRTVAATKDVIIELYDDDGILGKDFMGSLTITPLDLYGNDNATSWGGTFTGTDETEFWVSGSWVY